LAGGGMFSTCLRMFQRWLHESPTIRWLGSRGGLTIPIEEYDRVLGQRTALVMLNRVCTGRAR
jgi:hypothetical protein